MRWLVFSAVVFFAPLAAAQEPPVPRASIAAGLRQAKCQVPLAEAMKNLEPQELAPGMKLLEVSCWRAAYNFGSILFAYDPARPKDARLLRFRVWDAPGKRLKWQYALGLPSYDGEHKRLRSYYKGRGPADCGSAGAWLWTGREFALESYWLKADCDGELFDPEETPDKWRVYPPR